MSATEFVPTVIIVDPPRAVIGRDLDEALYTGASRIRSAFFYNLLRSPKIGRVVVLSPSMLKECIRKSVAELHQTVDLDVLTLAEIRAELGKSSAPIVVHTLNADLNKGIYLRSECGNPPWPVFGLTHDLSDPTVFRALVTAHAARVRPGDAVFCCSKAAQNVMLKLTEQARELTSTSVSLSLPIIPYGIEIARSEESSQHRAREAIGLPQSAFIFLFFGRLSGNTKANLLELLRTFAAEFHGSSAMLILAGGISGPHDQAYVELLAKVAMETDVQSSFRIFINPSDKIKETLFVSANVFVSPANSLQESFGLTLLEAMSYALPTVVTDWNGYRDIVEHGRTGYLIPARFTEALRELSREAPFLREGTAQSLLTENVQIDFGMLRHFMRQLASAPKLAIGMGQQGLQRAQRSFGWDSLVAEHLVHWCRLWSTAQQFRSIKSSASPFTDYFETFKGHQSEQTS